MSGVVSRMECIFVIKDWVLVFIRVVFWWWIFCKWRLMRICGGKLWIVKWWMRFGCELGFFWSGYLIGWRDELEWCCIVVFCIIWCIYLGMIVLIWCGRSCRLVFVIVKCGCLLFVIGEWLWYCWVWIWIFEEVCFFIIKEKLRRWIRVRVWGNRL